MPAKISGGKRCDMFRLDDPWRVTIIGLDTPDGPEHPYYHDDPRLLEPVPEAFVANLAYYGNLEAVTLAKDGVHTDGPYAGEPRYIVIAGRQRTRGVREAVKRAKERGEEPPKLKVEITRGDEELLTGIMVSENEHKRRPDILVQARQAARLLAMGHDVRKLALSYGVDGQTIQRWLKLAELAPKVQRAVQLGDISATAAVKLHSLSRAEQEAALAELLDKAKAEGKRRPTVDDASGAAPTPKPRALLPKGRTRKLVADDAFMGSLSRDAQALLRVLCGDEAAVAEVPGLAERLG